MSTYAGIVRLVSEAESAQAPFVRLADRYALWFLPLSLAVAEAAWALGGAARAVAVLVVATPCPLILAAPVALVSGLSAAARRGIVVKNGGVLERLARCTTVLLDKTGTLTAGQPAVTAVVPAGALSPEEILGLAASLDQASGHVLATAVVRAAAERGCPLGQPADVTEQPGQGIAGTVAGRRVRLGRADWPGSAVRRPGSRPCAGGPGWTARSPCSSLSTARPRARSCSRTGSGRTPGRRSARCIAAASPGSCSPPATGPRRPAPSAR
jgi:cation transport ATPase